MLDLSKLPQDVIYHILGFLSVEQSLALSRTCHSLYDLARSDRSYWFTALQASKSQGHTTAYLSAVDLSMNSDVPTLEHHARTCAKFERLWSKSKLTPTRILTGQLPDALYCLFGVHGTDYVVMHSPQSGYVHCWDNITGETRESIYLGCQITDTSPLNESPNQVSIALLVQENTRQHIKLMSITIDDAGMPILGMQHIADLGTNTRSFNIFLSEEIVGVTGNENNRVTIYAFNIDTGARSFIRTDVQMNLNSYTVAMTFNEEIYLVDMTPPRTCVYTCAREYLPFGDASSRVMNKSLLDTRRDFMCHDLDELSNDYYCALVSGARRGIAFTTLTQLVGRRALHVVLWDPRATMPYNEPSPRPRPLPIPPRPTPPCSVPPHIANSSHATSSRATSSTSPTSPTSPISPNSPTSPIVPARPAPCPAQHIDIPGFMLVPLGPWYLVHFPNSGRHLLLAVGRDDDGMGEDDEGLDLDLNGGVGLDEDEAEDMGQDEDEGQDEDARTTVANADGEPGTGTIGLHANLYASHAYLDAPHADEDNPYANAPANGDPSLVARLYLVHYVPETSSHSVHEVPFPDGVDPRNVTSLSFDDYNGVVTLTTLENVAYCMHLI
ncbi:hypothetical protein BD626DRAFT_624363 [Schizophyllum amplum]|uniref:F-box domain-containing protein n=1 Tax=Schizophyllum amplum TaxID=97359 RepID=A0A550CVU2_9AGAR|nr:hypothetical protein BD626DRAFT_624363 [Auriculariopsis ampla]